MGGEDDLFAGELKLLEELAGVAVAEDGVGGEVVGRMHEVRGGGGRFAGAGDAGFGVGDDAVGEVDDVGAHEWSEREDDGGGVAAGVRDEAGVADGRRVELGRAVDGFGLEFGGAVGVGVVELVDGAVGFVLETPGGGEVDDLDVVLEGDGGEFAGLLMRQGEEEEVDAFFGEGLEGEGDDEGGVGVGGAGEGRVDVGEAQGLFGACAAEEDGRGGEARVVEEKARELGASVAGDAGDGDAEGRGWVYRASLEAHLSGLRPRRWGTRSVGDPRICGGLRQ